MAIIETEINTEKDLTIFTIKGSLTADEIIEHSSNYYIKKPTKLVLWDVTSGSVSNISTEEFNTIAYDMKKYTNKRSGGRTALVCKRDVDFGIARLYEVLTESWDLPVAYQAFRNVEEAMEWLKL